ncbi:hypothetical protein CP556_19945 [Natrinema sp. CBA1119]|uniref:hypothetical protein n=1 Tax=Natrinema sp. CBA1119 TaxID=1608465 RepID=UPI000BF5BD11|nr:hypothetical protein [Natrinema sp. CBA1119]PGF18148.1 hypothetical protein CP556_19945 [Natrinema sp. CBA1119]
MHDVIPTIRGSDGSLLAASLACFAVAGVATAAALDGLGLLLGATGLAVVGVYCVARYAQSVSRQTLAVTALALWVSFLGVAGAHAVGLESIGSIAPGPAEATVVALTAVTWATLLAAAASTIFLGFREYGSPAPAAEPDDQMFDGDASDYSTR